LDSLPLVLVTACKADFPPCSFLFLMQKHWSLAKKKSQIHFFCYCFIWQYLEIP